MACCSLCPKIHRCKSKFQIGFRTYLIRHNYNNELSTLDLLVVPKHTSLSQIASSLCFSFIDLSGTATSDVLSIRPISGIKIMRTVGVDKKILIVLPILKQNDENGIPCSVVKCAELSSTGLMRNNQSVYFRSIRHNSDALGKSASLICYSPETWPRK